MLSKSSKPLIKRLFFDREKKSFLDFDLEQNRTCKSIQNQYKKEISEKIEKKYGKDVNLNNFAFIISDPKINRQTNSTSLIEIKVDLNYDIYDFLTKQQYILYYTEKSKHRKDLKSKARNKLIVNNERFFGIEKDNDKEIEKYITNEKIYRYDEQKNKFNKEKSSIDEKNITFIIDRNNQITVEINFIRKIDYYYDNNAKTKIPPCLEGKNLKEIPDFLVKVHTPSLDYIFGQYRKGNVNQPLENAIKKAKIKCNNITIEYDLNNELMNSGSRLFAKTQSILSKCFSLKEIMQTLEIRKIFLHFFEDKKISAIIENILSYKINNKNKNYLLSLMNIKQILEYSENNYLDIFNENLINKYKIISSNAEEAISKLDNKSEKYEDDIKEILKDIFIDDLFDEVYYTIFEKYIEPFHNEITNLLTKDYEFDKKPLIIQKLNKITANIFLDILSFRNIDSFNCLCNKNDNNADGNGNVANS